MSNPPAVQYPCSSGEGKVLWEGHKSRKIRNELAQSMLAPPMLPTGDVAGPHSLVDGHLVMAEWV